MKKLLIFVLFIVNLWSVELSHQEALKISKCDGHTINNPSYLARLFVTSNYDFNNWRIKPEDVSLYCEPFENFISTCRLVDQSTKNNTIRTSENFGTHTMGSIQFDTQTGKLEDITADIENPILLTYNSIWKDIVMSVYNNPERSYVQLNQKSYLYNKPNDDAKSDKFLIKNDCALVIKKTKDWYLLYYHNTKLKTDTLLWMKAEDVLK